MAIMCHTASRKYRNCCNVPHSILEIQSPHIDLYQARVLVQSLSGAKHMYVSVIIFNLFISDLYIHINLFLPLAGLFHFSHVSPQTGDDKAPFTDSPTSRAP